MADREKKQLLVKMIKKALSESYPKIVHNDPVDSDQRFLLRESPQKELRVTEEFLEDATIELADQKIMKALNVLMTHDKVMISNNGVTY